MKKIFFPPIYLFACLFISLFLLSSSVVAGTNVKPNISYFCLNNQPGTTDTIALPYHDPPAEGSVTKHLVGTFPAAGATVYGVVCEPSPGGRVCTTGMPAVDVTLFGVSVAGSGILKHVGFDQNTGGKKPDGKGAVKFNAVIGGLEGLTGASPQALTFYGAMVTYPSPVGRAGSDGTQKQGTFDFKFKDGGGTCAQINWTHYDPYGVVFDAKSLEPLAGVKTTILDSTGKKLSNTQFFYNDLPTDQGGIYNYGVPPGVYIMDVTPPSGYRYDDVTSGGILHPNAKKVYEYQDSVGSMCTIYTKNALISEVINTAKERDQNAPDPECRNIALTPLGAPKVTNVTGTYQVSRLDTGEQTFSGKVTHPLTYIMVKQEGKEVEGPSGTDWKKDRKADNTGAYSFKIPPPANQTLPVTIQYIKADLTGNLTTQNTPSLSFKSIVSRFIQRIFHSDVHAQSESSEIVVDLVPSFIEGYAYGDQKQIVRNAQVALRIKGAKTDYYQTTADANGYFYIPKENLPLMEFTIEITSPLTNKRTSFRLHEFAKANESYLTKNNINLITGMRSGKSVTDKKTLSPFDFGMTQNELATAESQTGINSSGSSDSKSSPSGRSSDRLPISKVSEAPARVNPLGPAVGTVLVLIFLIIVAGAVAAWAIMQKNRQQLPPMY
jgi:hypothetical protein